MRRWTSWMRSERNTPSSKSSSPLSIASLPSPNQTVRPLPSPTKVFLLISLFSVTLVNKDQLDILGTLRESVNEDKVVLEADVDRLRKQTKELGDKNRMQLEQINALLLEKVSLQTDGIGQREQMLLRERAFG